MPITDERCPFCGCPLGETRIADFDFHDAHYCSPTCLWQAKREEADRLSDIEE